MFAAFLFSLCVCMQPHVSYADYEILLAKESDLPFQLSPSKFSNSPSKFSNSVSKFSNSPSKFSNSPSKFSNSPSKHSNGSSGDHRLLLKRDGQFYYVGYYVWSDDGLLNFFSSEGTRLFYSPPDTGAIFDGEDGEFCGTLASYEGQDVLVITEKGQIAFAKSGVAIVNTNAAKPSGSSSSPVAGDGHWI